MYKKFKRCHRGLYKVTATLFKQLAQYVELIFWMSRPFKHSMQVNFLHFL